jgi:2-keto-myo-inositol isomerase
LKILLNSQKKEKTSDMNISINQNTIIQCGVEEFLEASSEAGFKGVELKIDKIRTVLYKKPLKEILNLIKKLKIEVVSLNAFEDFSFVPEQNLGLLEAECNFLGKLSSMIECPMIVACPTRFYESDGFVLNDDDVFKITKSRLSLIDDILNKYSVKVGFEPIGFPEYSIRDIKSTRRLFEDNNLTSTEVVIDVYNLFRSEVKPEELVELKEHISLVHLNDAVGDVPFENLNVLYNRTFPGEGIIDVKKWIDLLNKESFNGYYSLELFDKKIWEMRPKEAAVLCFKKLNDYLNK